MCATGRTLTFDRVNRDTAAWLAYFDDNPIVDGPVGAIGYCMSWRYVVAVAGTFPERFGAVASLYGVGIVTGEDDSPHRLADRIRAELYLGFAEEDCTYPRTSCRTSRLRSRQTASPTPLRCTPARSTASASPAGPRTSRLRRSASGASSSTCTNGASSSRASASPSGRALKTEELARAPVHHRPNVALGHHPDERFGGGDEVLERLLVLV